MSDIGYPRTPHLDGSGIGSSPSTRAAVEWESLADRNVVLEEKMDGAETSFEFDDDLRPLLRFRGSELDMSARGGREKPFDRLKDWFLLHADTFFDRFDTRYRVYGEWLAATHRIFYDALPSYFLEFDILDKDSGVFLDTPGRAFLTAGIEALHSVKVVSAGKGATLPHPRDLIGPSAFQTERWLGAAAQALARAGVPDADPRSRLDLSGLSEGIYGKVEENGRVEARFKWVRPSFVSGIVEAGNHWRDGVPLFNVLRA